jgi:hypothetical protein
MSVQTEELRHPMALYCLNLLHIGKRAAGAGEAKRAAITLDELAAMPKKTQLLLAHCLERRNPELMLLDYDTDAAPLTSAGWLVSVPCETIGMVCFRIKPHIWSQLKRLRLNFLTEDVAFDLEYYRKGKSAAYPYVWW